MPLQAALPCYCARTVLPALANLCPQIEADEEAKKALDWVREMYAFSVAVALEHVQLEVQVVAPGECLAAAPLIWHLQRGVCMCLPTTSETGHLLIMPAACILPFTGLLCYPPWRTIAQWLNGVPAPVQLPPESVTMIQPPADHKLGKAHLVRLLQSTCAAAIC